jgi:hypothetical protein
MSELEKPIVGMLSDVQHNLRARSLCVCLSICMESGCVPSREVAHTNRQDPILRNFILCQYHHAQVTERCQGFDKWA